MILSEVIKCNHVNPKSPVGGGGGQFDPPPLWFFQKCIFQREGEPLVFFVAINIIISDIFPEIFIDILQVVQKI